MAVELTDEPSSFSSVDNYRTDPSSELYGSVAHCRRYWRSEYSQIALSDKCKNVLR